MNRHTLAGLALAARRSAMMRFVFTIALVSSLPMVLPANAGPTSISYEPPLPLRMLAAPTDARSFYVEFRAREEGAFGHSYIVLGASDGIGVGQAVVVGFLPKSADDDRWSKFGVPVTGIVGSSRSDLLRRPRVRFRISLTKARYSRILKKVRSLRDTWTTYELIVRNCNSFVGEIAKSAGLITPFATAQYPLRYVAELRVLNSR